MSEWEDNSDPGGKVLVWVGVSALCVILGALVLADCKDCAERGGVYVDSPWGYECVQPKK